VRGLLSLRMRPLQSIAVVLATISHGKCLTLQLAAAHDLGLHVADELRASRRLLKRLLAAHELLLFSATAQAVHGTSRRI
jgi:hypothetical protein